MADKRGPLSKVEKYFIEGNMGSLTPKKMAAELKRSVKQVEFHIAKQGSTTKAKKDKKNKNPRMEAAFAKQEGGITMLTEVGSELGDTKSKRQIPSQLSDAIFKPKG